MGDYESGDFPNLAPPRRAWCCVHFDIAPTISSISTEKLAFVRRSRSGVLMTLCSRKTVNLASDMLPRSVLRRAAPLRQDRGSVPMSVLVRHQIEALEQQQAVQ